MAMHLFCNLCDDKEGFEECPGACNASFSGSWMFRGANGVSSCLTA